MENGQIKVLGVSTHEKDGKRSWVLHGYTPFDTWENGKGFKSVSEWTNRVDLSGLKPESIIVPIYGRGYQGKAILINVQVVSEK